MNEQIVGHEEETQPFYQERKFGLIERIKTLPPKTTIAAIILFLLGFGLIISGFICISKCSGTKTAALLTVGTLIFLPGCYAVALILKVIFSRPRIDTLPPLFE